MFMLFPNGLGKALTLSYDDGVEQDAEFISILNLHGLKCTFNLNSGCWAPEGTEYPEGTIHRRMPLSQAKLLYGEGEHEVAVHCLTHASLPELSTDQIIHEVYEDRKNLEAEFGGIIQGMAYPFGTYNDKVVDTLRACGILYSRTVHSTHDFSMPADWLRLGATCHHNDPQLMALADRFLNEKAWFCPRLFYLWGHTYEFEADNNWNVIEEFAEKMGGREDIWYATNIEICKYHLAYQQLEFSADGKTIFNPTSTELWFNHMGQVYSVKSGETLTL
ncbi:MAG: polysaccharide deacetylase family protein [Clostridia bacterium]|nr:polysaccharide deacetylase family protein [Clostridia bacterium]